MMGSHNCVMTQIVLSEDKYAELEALRFAPRAVLCSVRLNNRSQNEAFESKLKAAVSARFPNIRMASNNYANVSQSRYISQGICATVMCVMAFLILLIALVVIVSNIVNHIQVDLRYLGTLKAIGYTSRQIVAAQLLRFLGLTAISSVAGIALSYGLFPAVNAMMIAQTGIPYAMRFLPLPCLLTLAVALGTVALCVFLAAYRIKRLQPVTALRSGIQTHTFKRNPVPLEKSKMPLKLALALKTTFSSLKNNITVCITVLVLSLVIVFSGLMTENVIADMTPFLDLIVGETADSCINVQTQAEPQFLRALQEDDRVEKAYLYTSLNVSHADGAELMATVCDDFSRVNNKNVVFKGRFPKFDNEIALAAKYAKQKGLHVGDEIRITANGKTETYLISGFTQITNNLGRDCLFTRGGYERLGEITDASYYIDLVKGTDIDAFNAQMKERFAGSVNTTINIDKIIQGSGGVYVSLMTIIVIAVLVFSAIIIAFVLYLLVRTLRNNKKHDYGILKSLGFTTRQLILQTALSFMPTVIVSTVVGILLGCIVINPLMSLFLRSLGIVKCTFAVPIGFVTVAGIALIALSFGLVCLLSRKIKKITPRTLLTE